ncbi:transcriptional activator of glycolytic enzymes-domain-containing protein [Blakeslea trispora]|nr:transcriptional activator of glycolytic enzymes-domain-containing protein [Blakeslea trispora]
MPQVETHLQDLKNQTSVLASQMQSLATLVQNFQAFPAAVFQQLEPFLHVNNQAHSMMQQWNRIVSEGATLSVKLNMPEASQQPESSNPPPSFDVAMPSVPTNDMLDNSADLPPISSASPSSTPLSSHVLTTTAATTPSSVPTGSLELNIKAFRNVKTLSALWRIWFDGLPGHHPICKFDEVFGVKIWRGTASDSKFYQRRHNIIIRIERFMQANSYTKDQALQILDQKRTRNNGTSLSLHYISEHLDEFFA